jgi:hypothetical protein
VLLGVISPSLYPSTNPANKESDMTLDEYTEKVVSEFLRNITDHVFLNIQNNEELMREYQRQVNENSLRTVNTAMGKKVREVFQLENGPECNSPKSWLIQGFTLHKKK